MSHHQTSTLSNCLLLFTVHVFPLLYLSWSSAPCLGYLSVHPSVHPSIHGSISLSIRASVHPSTQQQLLTTSLCQDLGWVATPSQSLISSGQHILAWFLLLYPHRVKPPPSSSRTHSPLCLLSLSLEGRVSVHSALQLPSPGCLGLTWFVPPTGFPHCLLHTPSLPGLKLPQLMGPPGSRPRPSSLWDTQ